MKSKIIENNKSKCLVQLKKVFDELNKKKKLYLDEEIRNLRETTPEPFCSSFDQHDAGEFGKLFLEQIENELKSSNLNVKNIIL